MEIILNQHALMCVTIELSIFIYLIIRDSMFIYTNSPWFDVKWFQVICPNNLLTLRT